MFDVTITTQPARRVAAMAHIGPYDQIGGCFQRLNDLAAARNLWPGTAGMMGIYHDDPDHVAAEALHAHAGLILQDGAAVPDGLEMVELPGGTYAALHYQGPYENIGPAWTHLFGTWLPASGRIPTGTPCYELYLNSPSNTAPENLKTDICLPLQD